MKKLFFLLFCFVFLSFISPEIFNSEYNNETVSYSIGPEFEKGWKIGWCEGWKDVKGQNAYCPYVPYPPYPKYGTDNYRGGYNRAFKYGRCKAQGYENCEK